MYFVRIPKILFRLFPQYQWGVARNQIALTFDDGPHPESTPALLEVLKEANCPTTHFLLGKNAIQYPELVKEIKMRHAIGHHSYHHLNGWNTSDEIYLQDVKKGFEAIRTNLFRPPYGKIKQSQWRAVQSEFPEMKCCQFNFMPGDFDDKIDSERLEKRMKKAKGGDIIVLHDRPECLTKYLPFLSEFIADWKAKGLEFVTLDV